MVKKARKFSKSQSINLLAVSGDNLCVTAFAAQREGLMGCPLHCQLVLRFQKESLAHSVAQSIQWFTDTNHYKVALWLSCTDLTAKLTLAVALGCKNKMWSALCLETRCHEQSTLHLIENSSCAHI